MEQSISVRPCEDQTRLYVGLLKTVLCRYGFPDHDPRPIRSRTWTRFLLEPAQRLLRTRGYQISRIADPSADNRSARATGSDWPGTAETMIGLARLANIESCVEAVLNDGVSGDLVETGAWRGGATIFMRGLLEVHGDATRRVWVADSFEGLPSPDSDTFPSDLGYDVSGVDYLKVDLATVRANFERYGLLDERVRFLPGWFKDTLPTAPISDIAVLRLDGDLYESTWQSLTYLYDRVATGGFVIVDDYHGWPPCRDAVDHFRSKNRVQDPLEEIDGQGVYWRKR